MFAKGIMFFTLVMLHSLQESEIEYPMVTNVTYIAATVNDAPTYNLM